MSTKGLNSGIDHLFGWKAGKAEKMHNRLRSHSLMHQLLNPEPIDNIGSPSNAAKQFSPTTDAATEAQNEEIRKKAIQIQTGGYASTILAGDNAGPNGTAASMLYGS